MGRFSARLTALADQAAATGRHGTWEELNELKRQMHDEDPANAKAAFNTAADAHREN